MCKRERGGEADESQGHSSPALKEAGLCVHALLVPVGGRDTSMGFSLLYPDVFLSIAWALYLEMERASSGKRNFQRTPTQS